MQSVASSWAAVIWIVVGRKWEKFTFKEGSCFQELFSYWVSELISLFVCYSVSYVPQFRARFKKSFTIFCVSYCTTNRVINRVTLMIMIYLLTASGLSPGGSCTIHIYTQTIHRTTQNKQYIEQHKIWENKNFGIVMFLGMHT